MIGFPKWINTKQDIEHLRTLYPIELKRWLYDEYLQMLVDSNSILWKMGYTQSEVQTLLACLECPDIPQ